MRRTMWIFSLGAASAFLPVPMRLFAPPSFRAAVLMVDAPVEKSEFEKYREARGDQSFEEAEREYRKFKGMSEEFDGGDSGGGVVGDGNVDLEDQHNSPTLGALRGGVSDLQGSSNQVGRGKIRVAEPVQGATEARTASAGKNYFGRSTGLADQIIENMSEEDVKKGKIDKVRAQQKENWFNQRAIHKTNRAQGQGVVYGESQEGKPSEGGYIAREALSSDTWRKGVKENEISQRDLANHLQELASKPAKRLDGENWQELVVTDTDEITETFEVRSSPRQTAVTLIKVDNIMNTFAPFQCGFVTGSASCFSVTPNSGTMNRRGSPIEVVVRYTPEATGNINEGLLVFETEDMKRVYKFIAST